MSFVNHQNAHAAFFLALRMRDRDAFEKAAEKLKMLPPIEEKAHPRKGGRPPRVTKPKREHVITLKAPMGYV